MINDIFNAFYFLIVIQKYSLLYDFVVWCACEKEL